MSDTEPSPLPQEIIGIPKGDTPRIEGLLKDVRTRYKECLAPILVDREKVDPKVIQFEKQLNELNERRAKFYGRKYNPPEILYIDRVQATLRSTEINETINKSGLSSFGRFDESAASYHSTANYILIFVNNFEAKDVDGWDVCRKIRHELSHAGSVRKHRAYREKNGDFSYEGYRMGARIDSKKRGGILFGLVIDEGHHAVEDEIFEGQHTDLLKQDGFLKTIPNGQKQFPGAKQRYEQLRQELIQRKVIGEDDMLTHYRTDNGMNLIGVANLYEDYSELMKLIYQQNPQLFSLARDFIYGDKMVAFARQVSQTLGREFFQKLMAMDNRDDVKKLVSELK
jgi:hypothetical protein